MKKTLRDATQPDKLLQHTKSPWKLQWPQYVIPHTLWRHCLLPFILCTLSGWTFGATYNKQTNVVVIPSGCTSTVLSADAPLIKPHHKPWKIKWHTIHTHHQLCSCSHTQLPQLSSFGSQLRLGTEENQGWSHVHFMCVQTPRAGWFCSSLLTAYSPTLEWTFRVGHYVVLRTLKHLCPQYIHSSFLSLMGIVHCKCDHMDKVLERQSWWHEICHSNTAFMQHCRMRMHQGVLSQRISPAGMWVDDRQCHQQSSRHSMCQILLNFIMGRAGAPQRRWRFNSYICCLSWNIHLNLGLQEAETILDKAMRTHDWWNSLKGILTSHNISWNFKLLPFTQYNCAPNNIILLITGITSNCTLWWL